MRSVCWARTWRASVSFARTHSIRDPDEDSYVSMDLGNGAWDPALTDPTLLPGVDRRASALRSPRTFRFGCRYLVAPHCSWVQVPRGPSLHTGLAEEELLVGANACKLQVTMMKPLSTWANIAAVRVLPVQPVLVQPVPVSHHPQDAQYPAPLAALFARSCCGLVAW
jgi:hypothetical protein